MQGLIITQLSLEQLKSEISASLIDALQKHLAEVLQTPKQEEYLTRQQTAKILSVSLPTLNEWTKEGIVIGHRINSRVRYKRSELEAALVQIKSVRHR